MLKVNMKKIFVQSIISIIAIFGMTYGRLYSVPDATSKLYGLPLNWGVHQLVTIAGPVDVWNVNMTYLVLDLIFWLTALLLLPLIINKRLGDL
jgi:hypothetical protein